MSDNPIYLQRLDMAYCLLVAVAAVTAVLGAVLFRMTEEFVGTTFQLIAPIGAFSLVGMFPLGVLLQLTTRRLFKPKEVATCIALTGVWSAIIGYIFVSSPALN